MFDPNRSIRLGSGALFKSESTWHEYLPDAGDWTRTALPLTGPLIVVSAVLTYLLGLVSADAATSTDKQSRGFVTFDLGNEQKRFTHLPANANRFSGVVSTIWAKPGQDATETLAINFISINLKDHAYPADLPSPKTMWRLADPLMPLATVNFVYVNALGQQWATNGYAHVQSFGWDGVIKGTFDNLVMSDTAHVRPDVVIRNGWFSVRIDKALQGTRRKPPTTLVDHAQIEKRRYAMQIIRLLQVRVQDS